MKIYKYLVFLMISSIEMRYISQYCVCRHVDNKDECQRSQICIWNGENCILRSGETYIQQVGQQDGDQCYKYIQEDCIQMDMCGFYLGECIRFTECSLFQKNQCQESSLKCVSDGLKCIEKRVCMDYDTEVGCQNKNVNGNYCFWDVNANPRCQDAQQCTQLPQYLMSDYDCRSAMQQCTVNDLGLGCEEGKNKCEQYTFENQCYFTYNKKTECFWEDELQLCFTKNCENKRLKTYAECNSYMSKCTTNGVHCIDKKECKNIGSAIGCVLDINNKKCVYHNGQCQEKSCITAPQSYNNYEQCQSYDQLLDCVSAQNGGCKDRPIQCQDYCQELDCKSVDIQDCIWFENKCDKRQCFHAPKSFNHNQCKEYGTCMGTLLGSCQQRPQSCQDINDQQFCDITYDESRCIWINGQCNQLVCSNLKLPKYDNHQKCQDASRFCTFNIEIGGCIDYICTNITDVTACTIDSLDQVCNLNDGCIAKKCKLAPSYYDTNEQCESWVKTCTVNIYEYDNNFLKFGCADKPSECSIAKQDQCYSTYSGFHCKWQSNQCFNQQCVDADSSHTTNASCLQFKVISKTCIINSTNNGCVDWPSACSQMLSQTQCELGLQDSTVCIWSSNACRQIDCIDAPIASYINNLQCHSFLSNCIVTSSYSGCMIRPTNLVCSQSPKNEMYDTHQECQAWNPNCTISDQNIPACQQKLALCSNYVTKNQCKSVLDNLYPNTKPESYCFWDYETSTCQSALQFDSGINTNTFQCGRHKMGELTHSSCENFMKICTINNISKFCVDLSEDCTIYTIEQACKLNKYQQPCYWDKAQSKCQNLLCSENTIAQTEAACFQYKNRYLCQLIYNEDGIAQTGCEDRPTTCSDVKYQQICNKTITTVNQRCYYYNNKCNTITDASQCKLITEASSDEECQFYFSLCLLQLSGTGCYSVDQCSNLVNTNCNSAVLYKNEKCLYYGNECRRNRFCHHLFPSQSSCNNVKTSLGILCSYQYVGSELKCVAQECVLSNLAGSVSDKYDVCHNYSSICTYDITTDLTTKSCVNIINCSDLTTQGMINYKWCNDSMTTSLQKCGFNFATLTCENRQCVHMKSANVGPLNDQACYDWNNNCVFDGTNCKSFDNVDCTQIKLKHQCLQYSQCSLQQNNCVSIANCELNTTAVSLYECQLMNKICILDYRSGQGCKYQKCDYISNMAICNSAHTSDGMDCKWSGGSCVPKSCNLFTIQLDCQAKYGVLIVNSKNISMKCYWCSGSCSENNPCDPTINPALVKHEDCHNQNVHKTVSYSNGPICKLKEIHCQDYSFQASCVVALNGYKCAWNLFGLGCIDYCMSIPNTPMDNAECQTFDSTCMQATVDGISICIHVVCSTLSATDCALYIDICTLNASDNCVDVTTCSVHKPTLCNISKDIQGYPCSDLSGICTRQSNLENCESQLSSDNHQSCESLFLSGICTVNSRYPNCTDLPTSCSLATQKQCYMDNIRNRCYWKSTTNQCIQILNCLDLGIENDSHAKCQSYLSDCTVNSLKNGCIHLVDCNLYTIKEQCYFDSLKIQCEWIQTQNKCSYKTCITAQLQRYSSGACQLYFDLTCSVNDNLTECELAKAQCLGYNELQCRSDGQHNANGTECFWNTERVQCVEKTCENGPKFALSNKECEGYMQNCQKGGCRLRICTDYYYAIDSACASIFPDKSCTTNGYQCIRRSTCEEVLIKDGCTFDKFFKECVWIINDCVTKTCNTATTNLTTHQQCQEYLSSCTTKRGGGCVEITECQYFSIKEACQSDKYNQGCFWDDQLQICFTDVCEGFCGDGIITNSDEVCDDGNYLPYDGCYKCQIQCSLGCLQCEGKLCQVCDSYGWKLADGQCKSICGDGIIVGKEYCDDGNLVEFDGCYNCEYSCDSHCLKCFQGECIQCPNGLYENQSYCQNKCGDGIFASSYEQCEDANTDNNDGCNSNCEIEKFWKCYFVDSLSVCIYNISPTIKLTTPLNSYGQSQEIILTFSEDVRLNSTSITEEIFMQLIQISISNLQDSDYTYEIIPILSIDYTLQPVSYKIKLNFYKSVVGPILIVKIYCDQLVNQYENQLASNQQTIILKDPFTLSSTQKMVAANAALFNEIVIYTLITVACVAFISGNLEIFWNLIDTLQQLSYMKYLNLKFPQNLSIYFEVFSLVTIQPITDRIKLSGFIEEMFQYNSPFIPAFGRFEVFSINCYFGINLESFIIILVLGFTNYVIVYFLQLLLTSLKYYNWPIVFDQRYVETITKIIKAMHFIQKICKSYYQYFFYSGLVRIYLSNFYDLMFSALLQVANFQTYDSITETSSLLALIVLIFNFALMFQLYSYLSTVKNLSRRFSIFFEGLEIKGNYWNRQFTTLVLIKKTFFIANLVLLQTLPPVQPILTSLISGFYSVYVYRMRPFANQFENYKIIITECLISAIAILFSVSESLLLFSQIEYVSLLGWVEIAGFSTILLACLFIDFYQQLGKPARQIFDILKKCGTKTTLDHSNSTNSILKEGVIQFY
ncbi:unnamed protein product (macronuclear) [Paramecium tetraurelia]|uniref:EGF-like domain-containing protein n=1 Tax=Paramecium tetraurelia TaxID=5888 RepID=A0C8G5_PARTE|nr:uncharacterized protein GSPATT00036215001 [Paramecium tetraurelia]CAK67082.1 unnamed protein product [Paramecium tetraurelia]|eukprot:XP_001434479.1 hypothetical protein (macronuclear) [Paramecium tetraurelia strain d4-2]